MRRAGWAFINVHAESGRGQIERDERATQLLHMSRAHEREVAPSACVLAGDFNAREGEDLCLRVEGWRDVFVDNPVAGGADQEQWTWGRGEYRARYDRVYTHGTFGAL